MSMSTDGQGEGRRRQILQATFDLILYGGVEQISTVAVHRAAGVSRTTLYRHFPTRESLLEGVIGFMSDETERRLKTLIAARPGKRDRIELIIDLVIEQQELQIGQRLLRVDPGFMMKLFDRTLNRNIGIFNDALVDIYLQAGELTGTSIPGDLIGNIMTRFFATLTLLPAPTPPGDLREIIRGMFRALLLDLRLPARDDPSNNEFRRAMQPPQSPSDVR